LYEQVLLGYRQVDLDRLVGVHGNIVS